MPFSNLFRRGKKEKSPPNSELFEEHSRDNAKSTLSNGNKIILERPPLLFHAQVSGLSLNIVINFIRFIWC